MSDHPTINLKVMGENTLHCAGCERTVEFTLSHVQGVESAKADHKTQTIEIVSTSREIDLEKVKADLEWLGFEVEVA